VARQRLAAAPRRQARPKGLPSANKVSQGLFIKIIFKKVKIKKLSQIFGKKLPPALFNWLKILTLSPLSSSHHIKYAKRHIFRVLNIGEK
jgi:hypothetical protein